MQYRKMGKWGVKLSSLGLGSFLTIGMKVGEKASREIVRYAQEIMRAMMIIPTAPFPGKQAN